MFLTALNTILQKEGFYSNIKSDTGGETYQGISRNNWPNWPGWQIVDKNKPLKQNQKIDSSELKTMVAAFYKVNFWNKIQADQFKNVSVATLVFDHAVNAGTGSAIRLLQNVLNNNFNANLKIDGVIGPKTLQAVNSSDQVKLFASYKLARENFYRNIVSNNPSQNIFLTGWLNRVASFAFNPGNIATGLLAILGLIFILNKK